MLDREKILKGLKCCTDAYGALCTECPYFRNVPDEDTGFSNCCELLCKDALSLINEQEEEIQKLIPLCHNVDINTLLGRKIVDSKQ